VDARGDDVGEFGLWWGRSTEVMRTWDTASRENFDPNRPAHVAEAMEELALPKQIGVTAIGLDTFNAMPAWKQHQWLKRMQRELPGAKFIIEPITCDFMHQLAPMYVLGTRWNSQDGVEFKNPHYLADFLNPGHEIWAMIDQAHVREDLGRAATAEEMRDVLRRFAGMGYVPLEHWRYPIDASIKAAESWNVTVPEDLREPAPTHP
jgi:hypothetical protein